MAINVYWACLNDQWMRAEEPENVYKRFYQKNISDKDNPLLSLNYCPAFNNNLKNLFAVKSIYDYNFKVSDGNISSLLYDQNFFDKNIIVRSVEKKAFSFLNQFIFFTEDDSLKITGYEYPFFEDNSITERCLFIPGQYDIGKWFRPLEFPFILKNNFNEFQVSEKEVLYYLRFHTEEKINFKQFIPTDKINKYIDIDLSNNIGVKKNLKKLDWWYDSFKIKKNIIGEIKKNLI